MAKPRKKPSPRKLTQAIVRQLALALPGVEGSTSYRTPAMKVRGKLIARLFDVHPSTVSRLLCRYETARE
jgi:hypothetical protein